MFKLMKIIWHHRGSHREPGLKVKRSMVLLLALAARQPVIMRDVLRDLDGFLRREDSVAMLRPLGELLAERIRSAKTEDNERAVEHLAAVVTEQGLLPANVTLGQVELSNLRLARSFSFVGETVEEIDVTASTESETSDEAGAGTLYNPLSGAHNDRAPDTTDDAKQP